MKRSLVLGMLALSVSLIGSSSGWAQTRRQMTEAEADMAARTLEKERESLKENPFQRLNETNMAKTWEDPKPGKGVNASQDAIENRIQKLADKIKHQNEENQKTAKQLKSEGMSEELHKMFIGDDTNMAKKWVEPKHDPALSAKIDQLVKKMKTERAQNAGEIAELAAQRDRINARLQDLGAPSQCDRPAAALDLVNDMNRKNRTGEMPLLSPESRKKMNQQLRKNYEEYQQWKSDPNNPLHNAGAGSASGIDRTH